MEKQRKSGQFRFKMNDMNFEVNIEDNILFSEIKDLTHKNMHYHAAYELFFVNEYPITLHTPDNVSEYSNCLVCIPPFYKHCIKRPGGQRILFSFKKNKKTSNDFQHFMESFFSSETPFSFEPDSKIYIYVNELSTLLQTKSNLTDEIIISIFKMIFYCIYKDFSKTNIPTSRVSESYIVKIDNLLSQFQSDINLQTAADVLCLSKKQTSRIIRKNYKKTLSELLCEKRLTVATELLEKSDKTVAEIVEYVNFPSESYFYAQFKKAYGCTPLKYKKQNISPQPDKEVLS